MEYLAMASSQTTSFTEKKKESIIDGRLFVQSVVMERIQTENNDVAAMEHVVSHIQQSSLFNLGRQHSDLYNEFLVEEFYEEASVRFRSVEKGGDVAEISAIIRGVEIRINRHLLEDLFPLPSSGLKMEELESFGSEDLLSSFWCVFIGYIADKKVENRIGAFEMCTNIRFRMMMAIMFGESVNWCQIILKRLQEEVSKPLSQKKSFGLLLNNIFSSLDVPFAMNVKKIGQGKFIGGSKPTSFNKDVIPADRPSIFELPHSANLRDVTKKSKAKKKKKVKKAHKSKPTEVTTTHVEAQTEENAEVDQPTALNLHGETPAEEVVTAIYADPEPMAATMDDQLLANIEGTGESTAFLESVVTAPVRVSTPVQDPYPHMEPSPVRDPSPLKAPTPWNVCHELITNFYIAQAEPRLKGKTKSVDHAPSRTSDDSDDDEDAFQAGLRMSREEAQESKFRSTLASQENQVPKVTAPQDETIQQPATEPSIDAPASPRSQHIVELIPVDRPMCPTHHASLLMLTGPEEPVARPDSPRSEVRKNRLDALGRHTVFIQDAVSALHKVGKALDKLNVSAAEEIGGVTSYLFNIANTLQVLPQLLKVALANIQQQKKEILEKEQAKYKTFATRSTIALKASGTKLTGHDKNLDDLSLSLQTLADKFNKIKGKQDDVMDLVHSINSHVYEINARKGEEESREAARSWRLQ
ncbi:hypothetical protein OROMI_014740 [Orobanche minor]